MTTKPHSETVGTAKHSMSALICFKASETSDVFGIMTVSGRALPTADGSYLFPNPHAMSKSMKST